MLKAFNQFFHVLSLLFTSAEDAAVSLNKATGVMRANVETWETTEKLKLEEKLAIAKASRVTSIEDKAA
ncbi:hypothetical protein D210916BOD24_15600 [Alteromonas sp. D210916BOD_24]|uniref:hypothetical protein n=1 Tax=Alteromonas sp. D210916BOD_24 TaxID=3157618 RepID=UPI00399CBD73